VPVLVHLAREEHRPRVVRGDDRERPGEHLRQGRRVGHDVAVERRPHGAVRRGELVDRGEILAKEGIVHLRLPPTLPATSRNEGRQLGPDLDFGLCARGGGRWTSGRLRRRRPSSSQAISSRSISLRRSTSPTTWTDRSPSLWDRGRSGPWASRRVASARHRRESSSPREQRRSWSRARA